jgi:hypothetical protein
VKQAARIISILFHPLLLPTYLVLLLGKFFPSLLMIRPEVLIPIAGLIFMLTFMLPAINLLMFKYLGNISSITLDERKERTMPFFFISLIYIVVTALFYYKWPISASFIKLMIIITVLVISASLITVFYKISVHSIGMWGGIGILFPLNKAAEDGALLWPTAVMVLVAGLVMSSRLSLNVHAPREVLFGSLVGFLLGFGGMIFLF